MSESPPPGVLVEEGRRVTFTFEGQPVVARAGQSIGAALYAAGQRVFTRSFKYHRPRGLFCVAGECPNCLMQVDGRPNVRTCVEPARDGQVVRHQNAWPSLDFDVLRLFDKLDRWLPVGFYYKRFHRPRWLWPVFEHVVRHIAGIGKIDVTAVPDIAADVEHLHTEVCVIGGGPAGLSAAFAAAEAGARVLLLERLPRLGGQLLYEGTGSDADERLVAAVRDHPRVRVLVSTTAFGLFEGNLIGAFRENEFLRIRAAQIVVCTGSRERPFVFHNNDMPGIVLSRGVLRLGRLYGVRAGRRAVVVADGNNGLGIPERLTRLGIEVAAVVEPRPRPDLAGVRPGSTVVAAHGATHLESVRVAMLTPDGQIDTDSQQDVECDLLCFASAPVPSNELLLQAGVRYQEQQGRWVIRRTVPGIAAAGGAAGTQPLARHFVDGWLRGAQAAAALGYAAPRLEDVQREWDAFTAEDVPTHGCLLPQSEDSRGHKRFICLCEDVTEKDLERAVAEGFDESETLKRYATVNMGPCQGKVCGQTALDVCARLTGRPAPATTSRPPVAPVELRLLAASRFHPVRRTPLHHWHEQHGARWLDAGLWKRPESYGDPTAEVRAVRTSAGLIDVSTLGKIELIGPDAAELLERVYVNRWADLAAGRVRYGVMCNEEGVLFDDGVGARLGPDRFFLTATTGNADGVVQWLELWKTTWRLNMVVVNHTAGLAAMNLAGPRAREILRRVSPLDLSPAAFPYLALREGPVAGVPCKLLRIGFVGELGYEIHCPSSRAWHVWEALHEAGAPFGIRPFGVEAQRILRLEKGHLIFGADTDALATPLDAGLEWAVRFEKPLFHGRETLRRLKELGPRSRLVGFTMHDRSLVPDEGCQVVERGKPVGRVTSARFSPTLRHALGLAWVPASVATVGTQFAIRWNGSDHTAVVTRTPFYDPRGQRLKS